MKTLFMETTEISPDKTIAEIEAVLIQYGANAVLKEYKGGAIDAVSFRIHIGENDVPFRLPCRWQAIAQVFRKRKNISDYYWTNPQPHYQNARKSIEDRARRVAWRQIFRWVLAQMALVETSMVKVEEVFFPYIQAAGGQTIYELHQSKLLQLGSGQ